MELLSKHATLHLAVAVATLAHIDRQTDRLDDGTNIDRCPVFSAAIYKYITCKWSLLLTSQNVNSQSSACYVTCDIWYLRICYWNVYNSENLSPERSVVPNKTGGLFSHRQQCYHPILQHFLLNSSVFDLTPLVISSPHNRSDHIPTAQFRPYCRLADQCNNSEHISLITQFSSHRVLSNQLQHSGRSVTTQRSWLINALAYQWLTAYKTI